MSQNGMSKKQMKLAEKAAKEQARRDAALAKARAIRDVQRTSNVSIKEAERIAKVQAKLDAKNAKEQARLAQTEAKRMAKQELRGGAGVAALEQEARIQAETSAEKGKLDEKYLKAQAKLNKKTGRRLSYEEQYAQYEALQEARAAQVLGKTKSGGGAGKVILVVILLAIMLAAVVFAYKFFILDGGVGTRTNPNAPVTSEPTAEEEDNLDEEKEAIRSALAEKTADKLDRIETQNPATLAYIAQIANTGFAQAYGWTMEACGIDPLVYAQTMTKGFTYEFSSIMVQDDLASASVNVDVKVCNIYEFENIVNGKVQAYNDTVEALTATPEQVRARLGQIFLESYSQIQPSNDRISLEFNLIDDEWVLDEESWAEDMDYLFGLV